MTLTDQARSFLFIPADRIDFIKKAHTRGADMIVIDLEDSILPQKKSEARENINLALDILDSNDQSAAVRVNGDLSNLVKDMESLSLAKLSAIVLPKVEYAGLINALDDFLGSLEQRQGLVVGSTHLIAMIESAKGCGSLNEISKSSKRLTAIALGSEDLSADLGCEPCAEALSWICQSMVVAARQSGIAALGFPGSISNISDLDELKTQIGKAKKIGMNGSLCIHPAQVELINSGFGYSEAEYAWAKRVVSAMKEAEQKGQGVATIEGKMVDAPVLARAKEILSVWE
jgi:citrate lyase subunit beta/citryl-CoA lyase